MNLSKSKGLQYESVARDYLLDRGLHCLEQNYYCRFGEIDLIMQESDQLCFVEVKYRDSRDFGGAINAISKGKQQKIIKTALQYIQKNQKLKRLGLRFDAMILQQLDSGISIDWIKNAFYAEPF